MQVEGSQSSALINNKIYLCGGLGPNVAINTCGIYDPQTNTFVLHACIITLRAS